MAGQSVGAIVAWLLLGRAMDRRGRRIVILGGVSLFIVIAALYPSIGTLGPHVYAIRIVDGVAVIMWYTALFTYAADLVPAATPRLSSRLPWCWAPGSSRSIRWTAHDRSFD